MVKCKGGSRGDFLNKGLEIRNAKLEKKREKRYTVLPDQIGLERKVEVRYTHLKRLKSGKYVAERLKKVGLQKENKVYFDDGSFIYINKKGTKIIPL